MTSILWLIASVFALGLTFRLTTRYYLKENYRAFFICFLLVVVFGAIGIIASRDIADKLKRLEKLEQAKEKPTTQVSVGFLYGKQKTAITYAIAA